MQFSVDAVRDLALLLQQSGLHEISFATQSENEPLKIVVCAAPRSRRSSPSLSEIETTPSIAENDALLADDGATSEATISSDPVAPASIAVTATAVGLFCLAPDVAVGSVVKKNQAVAFVESLKIPTEVRAPQAGTLHEVFAENGQGVEYGQTLLSLLEAS